MNAPLILTFDIGTQSLRALLVTPEGTFTDKEQLTYETPYISKAPGWAEQAPGFYYEKLAEASRALLARNPDAVNRIGAVTVTCIRDTVVCLDKNREPLRDIILWLDSRKAKFGQPYGLAKKALFAAIGMGDSIKKLYKATPANWLMQNEPDTWAKLDKYVMLPTYINYLLTGELKDSAANMIGHIPFDYKNRRWTGEKGLTRFVCDVPEEKLCALVDSGDTVGRITEKASAETGIPAGLPLIASGSDKGCETLGLSVVNEHKAAVSFGTTATLQMAVRDYFEPQPFMPAYPAVPNDMFNPEFEIYRGFWLISWFVKEFGAAETAAAAAEGVWPEKLLDEKITQIPPGSEGLLLQPFWTPGITNPNARGAIVGFADHHTRHHLYRAIIEGILLELYHGLSTMEKRSKQTVRALYAGGGGARSDVVCQIAADLFGLPVSRIQTHEASAIGAAMVAFVATGVFPDYDEAISHMVQMKDTFAPDPENHEIYMDYYRAAYAKLPDRLRPVEKALAAIRNRRTTQ